VSGLLPLVFVEESTPNDLTDLMDQQYEQTVLLDTFEPAVARAVAAVLRRHGLQAWTRDQGAALPGLTDQEVAVLVPPERRDEALALLIASMEEVAEEARSEPDLLARRRGAGAGRHPMEDAEDGPPIVMERFRRLGFLAFLLVPLLMVTLATQGMPRNFALVVFIGGLVAVAAWRNRHTEP
jgi:hypothetical protein